MTFQGKSASHFSTGFGARSAVYCVAALLFVVSAESLFHKYRLFLVYDLDWWQKLSVLAFPGLLVGIVVGLLLLKRWAWALAIVLSLINGIMGLVILWFRPEEMPWVLNTPSRVAWLVVNTLTDFGVVVVLLLKPVRVLFFRRPPPPAAVLNKSGV